MKKFSITTGNIILPISYIYRTILPSICPKAMPFEIIIPISFINTAVFKVNNFFFTTQNRFL
jgi:hypothetical protein